MITSCFQMNILAGGAARTRMRHDESSRALILGFKHADRTEGAAGYGAWLARADRDGSRYDMETLSLFMSRSGVVVSHNVSQ